MIAAFSAILITILVVSLIFAVTELSEYLLTRMVRKMRERNRKYWDKHRKNK